MRTKAFWIDTLERAVKTFAQALLAVLVVGVPVWDVDWVSALGIALTATIMSVLTSIASGATGDPATASVVDYVGEHRVEG